MFDIVRAVRLLRLLPACRTRSFDASGADEGLPRGVGRLGLTERESGPFPSMYWWRAGASRTRVGVEGGRFTWPASPSSARCCGTSSALAARLGSGTGGGAAHPRRGGSHRRVGLAGRPGQRLPVRPGGGDVLVVVGALQAPGPRLGPPPSAAGGEGLLRPATADAPCGADPVAAGARRPRELPDFPAGRPSTACTTCTTGSSTRGGSRRAAGAVPEPLARRQGLRAAPHPRRGTAVGRDNIEELRAPEREAVSARRGTSFPSGTTPSTHSSEVSRTRVRDRRARAPSRRPRHGLAAPAPQAAPGHPEVRRPMGRGRLPLAGDPAHLEARAHPGLRLRLDVLRHCIVRAGTGGSCTYLPFFNEHRRYR